MRDRDVINAFLEHLQKNGYPRLKIECWPEDHNRRSKEIDAIAGPFAIEHTSIDTILNQRRDNEWFMQVVGGLEEELSPFIPFRLTITLEYRAVKKGQDWEAIRDALRMWIITDALLLRDGNHTIDGVPGVPFRIRVAKDTSRRPRLRFYRSDPGEDITLSNRIRELLAQKAQKLLKYQNAGKTTLLLLENDDPSLMGESKMLAALREAFSVSLPDGIEELWYADTSIPHDIWFKDFTHYRNAE